MKNPEDDIFQIFAPHHTTISILQYTHDNVLSLFAVVCVVIIIIIIIYCTMENGIIIQVANIFARTLIHTIVFTVQQVYKLRCISFQMNSIPNKFIL